MESPQASDNISSSSTFGITVRKPPPKPAETNSPAKQAKKEKNSSSTTQPQKNSSSKAGHDRDTHIDSKLLAYYRDQVDRLNRLLSKMPERARIRDLQDQLKSCQADNMRLERELNEQQMLVQSLQNGPVTPLEASPNRYRSDLTSERFAQRVTAIDISSPPSVVVSPEGNPDPVVPLELSSSRAPIRIRGVAPIKVIQPTPEQVTQQPYDRSQALSLASQEAYDHQPSQSPLELEVVPEDQEPWQEVQPRKQKKPKNIRNQ